VGTTPIRIGSFTKGKLIGPDFDDDGPTSTGRAWFTSLREQSARPQQVMPQIVLTSFTQASSHLSWQQNASIEQISATHGSHVIASSSPAAQIGCAQSHAAPQSDIESATHASVNAPEQHVGSCAHTAATHGSAPHVAFAVAMQSPSHAGGEP
jgi:hypothetical protein